MPDSENPLHEANRKGWDAVSARWQANIDATFDWRRVPEDIRLVLDEEELKYFGSVSGRSVCVLGSGDNLVAFALAGAGAQVTSVDISGTQLEIAAGRAEELGLPIQFERADVTDLRGLPDGHFDFVYTGGHVAVWVSDLKRYYDEGCRILKPGGLFLVNEYHPFRRLWRLAPGPLDQEFHYFDRGPLEYDRSDDLPEGTSWSLPSFEFHWTVADMTGALLDAGCALLALEEYGGGRQQWEEGAPLEGMPANLLLVGRKKSGEPSP